MQNGLPTEILVAYTKMLNAVTGLQDAWVKEFQFQEAYKAHLQNQVEQLTMTCEMFKKRWEEDLAKLQEYRDKLQALEDQREKQKE